jgi:hypothetical protein
MGESTHTIIDALLNALDAAGLTNYSAVLHGSAARGQDIPGWSDINLVLITDDLHTNTLEQLRGPLTEWRAKAGNLPLMLTRQEWQRSADAYPLEITEMRTGYQVLRGSDPLAGMTVAPADLRLALEREFRGKLLRLRQAYVLLSTDAVELGTVVRRSVSAVLFLCRGLLVLVGEKPPNDPVELVEAAAKVAKFDGPALARVVTRRGTEGWKCTEGDMRGYLGAVEQAARFVDHYQTGVQS